MNEQEWIVMGVLIMLALGLVVNRHLIHKMEIPAPMATRRAGKIRATVSCFTGSTKLACTTANLPTRNIALSQRGALNETHNTDRILRGEDRLRCSQGYRR